MDDNKIGLIAAAEDMLSAIQGNDPEALSGALESFFQMCESVPHEEAEGFSDGGSPQDGDGLRGFVSPQRRQSKMFGEY